MKITFWGTAAQEGIPGIFCDCDNCRNARRKKGMNIRTRSQLLINNDLLVDLGPDTYMHSLMYDFDLSRITHILITHPHPDHFYPSELINRLDKYVGRGGSEALIIHGAEETLSAIRRVSDGDERFKGQSRILFDIMKPYETHRVGSYMVTPLPARHTTKEAFSYLVEDDGSAVLLFGDTGRPTIEIYDYLVNKGVHINAVVFDTTYGNVNTIEKFGAVGHHMGLLDNFASKEYLAMKGVTDNTTEYIASHFSHLGADIDYDAMSKIAERYGLTVAFDGMEIDI